MELQQRLGGGGCLERVEQFHARLDFPLLANVAELDEAEDDADQDGERLDGLEDQLPVHLTSRPEARPTIRSPP